MKAVRLFIIVLEVQVLVMFLPFRVSEEVSDSWFSLTCYYSAHSLKNHQRDVVARSFNTALSKPSIPALVNKTSQWDASLKCKWV
ncbi:hypothetical protein NPIL_119581 [Nephila pilipes]|uniref:Secreted protein n=1 Tax=Nephila pilipes TaxID=299642 RepID=A0A8X6TV77_NEPPI|nr:hypothetical protein NPIL_119581 [Nephila pilipes]